jgi:hypothetical protein
VCCAKGLGRSGGVRGLERDHAIGVLEDALAVRHEDGGAPASQVLERLRDGALGLGVEVCGDLVQDE